MPEASPSEDQTEDLLTRAIATVAENEWLPLVIGEGQLSKFEELSAFLKEPFSPDGHGKKFTCGFSYWGVGAAHHWRQASDASNYKVMKESITKFQERWDVLKKSIADDFAAYVSMGPGTGEKDLVILKTLCAPERSNMLYGLVDVNPEMIRESDRKVRDWFSDDDRVRLPSPVPVGIQLDFSYPENLERLQDFVRSIVGDRPILYSLLGNTVANYDEDSRFLRAIGDNLLRPDIDGLLIEVASTNSTSRELADSMVAEYRGSTGFTHWVTSGLFLCTDLSPREDRLEFHRDWDESSLSMQVLYKNNTKKPIKVTLLDASEVDFESGDTIRLSLTRKYSTAGKDLLFSAADFRVIASSYRAFAHNRDFGMTLILAGRRGPHEPVEKTGLAEEIWSQ